MVAPILLRSCAGSTRASSAVLSQTEATPGAVTAIQAVPEDSGRLPPFAAFSVNNSDDVGVEAGRLTVMSAPIRVSQNGESACFTETAAKPFLLSFEDQEASGATAGERAFEAGTEASVEASTLSWLQSSS